MKRRAFAMIDGRLSELPEAAPRVDALWIDCAVGRIADVLEAGDRMLDRLTQEVFNRTEDIRPGELRHLIRASGRIGEDLHETRLNLMILRRALVQIVQLRTENRLAMEHRSGLRNLDRDTGALTVHADHLAGRVTLAIDATVGLISLAQNDTARVYSLVAVLFLPATLVASIFGMNVASMPMPAWAEGFEVSLVIMEAATVVFLLPLFFWRWL